MKKHIVSVLFAATFAAVSASRAQQVAAPKPEAFEVVGKRIEFRVEDYNLDLAKDTEKVLRDLESVRGPGTDFTLLRVTAGQWMVLEARGVKLASLWDGDVRRDWIEMKFGYIGPILTDCDGKPGFVLKTKKGNWDWTYKVQEVSEAAKAFWIAIDIRATMKGV